MFFGERALQSIDEDILFISPSARRDSFELIEAEKRGVILSSDAELFFALNKSDVYAVTGSDGKSTTTHLSSLLISDGYKNAVPCGNIGCAMTPQLDRYTDAAYITELSSFQLMYLKPKSERALITNITKNHLNWHRSFEEYIDAKRSVLEGAKNRIINYDCPISERLARDYNIFAAFSANYTESELRSLIKAELYVTISDGAVFVSGEPTLNLDDVKLPGRHNLLNFMSAIAMSYGIYKKDTLLRVAREFGGLPHRCELVGTRGGVSYYNSSVDSSPKRTSATLSMLKGSLIPILGGRSKGLDYLELMPTLKEKARLAVITGECRGEIEEAILSYKKNSGFSIPYVLIDDFYEAINYAISAAQAGDKVILSPAATSYDCFQNFEERGRAFKLFLKSKGI